MLFVSPFVPQSYCLMRLANHYLHDEHVKQEKPHVQSHCNQPQMEMINSLLIASGMEREEFRVILAPGLLG